MNKQKIIFPEDQIIVGLKIDVDTYRGTKIGVPALLDLLGSYGIKGSFFFSLGPDNMGRHLWRLFKPRFFMKMMRGNAAKLYGLDILLKGVFWPGPLIGMKFKSIMKRAKNEGHEIALHSYDHHKWQRQISKMSKKRVELEMNKALETWFDIFGDLPSAAGNPGWQLSGKWLDFFESEKAPSLLYRSDCRGPNAGFPIINGKTYKTMQIPTTLPTFDEVIGSDGIDENNYNDYIIKLLKPGKLNVLTIHTEVEGCAYHETFKDFLAQCKEKNIKFVPMIEIHSLLKNMNFKIKVKFEEIHGREGKLAVLGQPPQV